MISYLLDSNHLGELVHPRSQVWQRFENGRRMGARFGTVVPVLCEVEAGLAWKIEHDRCWTLMRRAASYVRIWPPEPPLARVFGDLFVKLK